MVKCKRNSIITLLISPIKFDILKMSTMTDHWLVHNAESDTCVPFQELKNILDIDISVQTLMRR